MTATTENRPALPSVTCAPWCKDGTGHTQAWHLEDQWCCSDESFVRLTREEMVADEDEAGKRVLVMSNLSAYLGKHRDAVPHIALSHNGEREVTLSPAEAVELAGLLVMYAEMAAKP